ncbi:hypothetical protein BX600DRAFT_524038 [Xylariales sp. PMI_506]|nr:hypothetical protein BX600DRAFT_524038 [Xylariales sp. PMI_506]
MPNLWEPKLRRDFHRAVESLHNVTRNPAAEFMYRDSGAPEPDSPSYTLRLRDELQLADHIAFLAHSQEGVQAVSGVCVEETVDGLVIRLASNHTPIKSTEDGLRRILNTVSEGARLGVPSDTLRDNIFEDVVHLSQDRILQRIRPVWVNAPQYYRGGEEPLWVRIERVLERFNTVDLIPSLDKLISNLKLLDKRIDGKELREALKTTVHLCADISYSGGHGSLEKHLQTIPGCQDFSELREVAQLDKLARYLGSCKDLSKIALSLKYHHLTQNIALKTLSAYDSATLPGASRPCHVHAEVQLILYYEQNFLQRPPRAIGCSKLACFLCDMLIQKLGAYHISYAHRRLYNQWMVPDVSWMSDEKVQYFRSIFRNMITEMEKATVPLVEGAFRSFGLESRAILPLLSNSDLSFSPNPDTQREMPELAKTQPNATNLPHESPLLSPTEVKAVPAPDPPSTALGPSLTSIDLHQGNLPYQHHFHGSTEELYLDLEGLLLIFDCPSTLAGFLSIREINIEKANYGNRLILVSDIPTTEMMLDCASKSTPKFWLQMLNGRALEIELTWTDKCG